MDRQNLSPLIARIGMLLFFALACSCAAPPTPIPPTRTLPPTPVLATAAEEIIGTWLGVGPHGLYLQFREDGIVHVARSRDGLTDQPGAVMAYWLEGTRLFMKELETPSLPSCGEQPGIYEAQLLASGSLLFRSIEDGCVPRRLSTALVHKPVD